MHVSVALQGLSVPCGTGLIYDRVAKCAKIITVVPRGQRIAGLSGAGKLRLPLERLPAGVYCVQVRTGGLRRHVKLTTW